MKYLVKYTQGNGYTCSCCSHWTNEIQEFLEIQEAITFVADLQNKKYKNNYFDEIEPIPTSKDDFNDDGTIVFDRLEFDRLVETETKRLAILKSEEELRRKEARKQTDIAAEKALLQTLKIKYES